MLLTAIGVPKNLLERIDITSSPVQEGHGNLRNEADFIIPKNTSVLAAANSVVTSVKDDFTIGGPNPIFCNYTKFITIMYEDEEYSRYDGISKLAHQALTKF